MSATSPSKLQSMAASAPKLVRLAIEQTLADVIQQKEDIVHRVVKPRPQSRPNKGAYIRNMWSTPEGRAIMMARITHKTPRGRLKDVPRWGGWTNAKWLAAKAQAQKETKIIMADIVANGLLANDDLQSKEALTVAVEIMRMPISVRDKLQAARTVLEYTKMKPGSKTEGELANSAEAFLGALLHNEKSKKTD